MYPMLEAVIRHSDEPSLWPGRLLAVAAVLLLIGVPIFVIKFRRRSLSVAQDDLYAGIQGIRPLGEPEAGDVRLVFHTYSGFLAYVTQRRHEVTLPADQARVLLNRALKHNLTWGFFAYGALFIPIISLVEYRSQAARIAAAMQRGFPIGPG